MRRPAETDNTTEQQVSHLRSSCSVEVSAGNHGLAIWCKIIQQCKRLGLQRQQQHKMLECLRSTFGVASSDVWNAEEPKTEQNCPSPNVASVRTANIILVWGHPERQFLTRTRRATQSSTSYFSTCKCQRSSPSFEFGSKLNRYVFGLLTLSLFVWFTFIFCAVPSPRAKHTPQEHWLPRRVGPVCLQTACRCLCGRH